ncbi:MAG: hypothetical protein K1W37_07845 [Lachnospiraceae bacterium]
MNKKRVAILAATALLLSGCSKKTIKFNNNLMEEYSFYEKSITKIINTMDVSSQQADNIFVILVDLGLDKEILSISKHNENYNLFLSGKYLTISLEDGEVAKITDNLNNTLYPILEIPSPELAAASSEPEASQEPTELIPLEIIGHHFEERDVYGYTEVQLFIEFNRALSEQELGTSMVPSYTYKYSLSTKEGEDFVVDYGKGNSLSEIFLNENSTEYEIASSGNGMREGKYVSNPLFNQDNIFSIRVELYKKCNDDKYNHDYELIDEYFYSADNDTTEKPNSSN